MRDDVERQAIEYAVTRSPELKASITTEYQWLVARCARRLQARWEPLEDLIQVCNVGLLEALERFDPNLRVSFATYAEATMRGVLRHHYRTTWRVCIPRRLQELHLTVSRLADTLTADLHRTPTLAELADAAGATVSAVIEAQAIAAWPQELTDDDDTEADEVAIDERVDALALLAELPELKRRVIYLRFFEERTQTETAAVLGVSQMTVSRAERAAIDRLRKLAS